MKLSKKVLKGTALALFAAALIVPAAQATSPDNRAGIRGIGVQPASPQGVLDAVKRSSPNQVGLAWQYLRDTGQIAPSSPQTILDAVKRTSPNQVGLAWQYLRDTGQLATASTASTPPRPDDRAGVRGIDPGATVIVSSPSAFDWSDAGIGALSGFGVSLVLGGMMLLAARRQRRVAAV